MTDELKNQVPGSEEGVVAQQPTTPEPSDGGVSEPRVGETPAPSPNPVDVEELRARYEKDIGKVKSTLQRQLAQVEQQAQERAAELTRQLHEARMQTMTDEERARYERQLENEEYQSLQNRLTELEREKEQQAATINAMNLFMSLGVPANSLNLSEGYDAVVNAGWQFITEELTRLRQLAENPPQQQPNRPAPLKQAPPVVNDKGVPSSGTTWDALRARFGSDEAVYRAVEEGRLDPSVIPPY